MSERIVADTIRKALETGETLTFSMPAGYEYFGVDVTPVSSKVVLRKEKSSDVYEIDLDALAADTGKPFEHIMIGYINPVKTIAELTRMGKIVMAGIKVKTTGRIQVSLRENTLMFVVL